MRAAAGAGVRARGVWEWGVRCEWGRRAVCDAWVERGVRRRAGGSGQAGPCGGKEGSGPLRAGPEKEVGRGGGRKTADRAGPRSRVGLMGFRDGVWVGSSLPFLFYFFPLFYF